MDALYQLSYAPLNIVIQGFDCRAEAGVTPASVRALPNAGEDGRAGAHGVKCAALFPLTTTDQNWRNS